MLAMLKTAESATLPTLASVSPKYAELRRKQTELSLEHAALRDEALALGRKHAAMKREQGRHLASAVTDQAKAARVAEVLGEPVQLLAKGDADRLAEITDRMRMIDEAQAELRNRISDEIPRASAEIQKMVAPEHRRLIREICEALVVVHKASAAYHAFADQLNADGVWWSALGPSHPLFLGMPQDPESPVARYLREARDNDHFPASRIPEECR
jgi:hypothetical protein